MQLAKAEAWLEMQRTAPARRDAIMAATGAAPGVCELCLCGWLSMKQKHQRPSAARPKSRVSWLGIVVALIVAAVWVAFDGDWNRAWQAIRQDTLPEQDLSAGRPRTETAPGPLATAPSRTVPLPVAAYQYSLQGRVVHVADGDTLTVRPAGESQRRVRLANIDAPEIGEGSSRPGQPYAQAARQALERLVAGAEVTLQCYEKDQYGRDICDVVLGDNDTANRRMVASGYAWANQQGKGKYLRDDFMRALESDARRQRLGLWADDGAIRPWVWRYDCWQQGKC